MTILSRVSRLFKADIHSIIDTIEEPELVLKQAVREMEEDIEKSKRKQKELEQAAEKLDVNKKEREQRTKEIDAQIEFCFGAGDEKLARSFVKKKLENQTALKQFSERQAEVQKRMHVLASSLAHKQEKLIQIKEKMELFTEATRFSSPGDNVFSQSNVGVSEEEIEVAFMQEKERFSGTTANG